VYAHFAIIAIFVLFAVGFVFANVEVLSRFLRPTVPGHLEQASKAEVYECGEPAIGEAWIRFDMRFYTTALVFLIFDVEVAFLFPWAVVFRNLRVGAYAGFAFVEVFLFLLILGVGFVYVWVKGDLDWVKSTLTAAPLDSATDVAALAKKGPDHGDGAAAA
jgi:NADH-quinone oxidoreductase subunit A